MSCPVRSGIVFPVISASKKLGSKLLFELIESLQNNVPGATPVVGVAPKM